MASGINQEAHRKMMTRVFETGATRNSDQGKYDYEAFLCPATLERYAEFMHKHRHLEDGSMRPGDNWQKGIPIESLMKSMIRHVMDARLHHRGFADKTTESFEDSLCSIIFNAMALLRHEVTCKKLSSLDDAAVGVPMFPLTATMVDSYVGAKTRDTGCAETMEETSLCKTIRTTLNELPPFNFNLIPPVSWPVDLDGRPGDVPHFYIAGPMRGLPLYNFPAFNGATEYGRSLGYEIVSPAELDYEAGFDPATKVMTDDDLVAVIARDLYAILQLKVNRGDGLALLPDWQDSEGARAEVAVAQWMGLRFISALDFKTEIEVTDDR